jgi:tetratricopeptide (TPR) repeat protein
MALRCCIALTLVTSALALPAMAWAHGGIPMEIAALDDKLAAQPDHAGWLVERAALLRRRGDPVAALVDLEDAYEADPELDTIALERGHVLGDLGLFEPAEWDLSAYLERHPKHVKALLTRARVHQRAGHTDAARRDYRHALALEPSVDAVTALGRLEEQAGDWEAAKAAYDQGLEALGDALVLRMALVRALTTLRDYDRALEVLDAVIAKARVPADLRLTRAEVLAAAGREDEARKERETALSELDAALIKRPSMLRRLSRAKALLALDREEEARPELEDLVETAPDLEEARELLHRARR